MSVVCQITDGYGPHTTSRSPLHRRCCDQAGMAEQNVAHMEFMSDVVHISLVASESDGHV